MAYYWKDNTELSAQDIQDLRVDDDKNGFRDSRIGTSGNTAISASKTFYVLGDNMKSKICTDEDDSVCAS